MIIIVSDKNILLEAIKINIHSQEVLGVSSPRAINRLASCKIVDLLIVDSDIKDIEEVKQLSFKVKNTINLSSHHINDKEIRITKPLRLDELIQVISQAEDDNWEFTFLGTHDNTEWIFDEQLGIVSSSESRIKLTDRESDILKALIMSPSNSLSKSDLLQGVWGYHPATDSNTIETHLYRLKQKLPTGMINIKDGIYSLILQH